MLHADFPPRVSAGGRQLLDRVFKAGVQTQAVLSRDLCLSQPTVARLLQGFVQDRMVQLGARAAEGRGNPSVDVRLAPDYAYAFGIGLMGDVVALALVDFAGGVRGQRRVGLTDMRRAPVLAQLLRFREELLAETGVDPARVVGAGMAISAFFTGQGQQLAGPPALEDWTQVELGPILEQALGCPVTVENDGAAAAVAESLYGVGRDCRDFAYLHLTNGFGGGIIADGRLFRGHRGNAGEFGGIWTVAGMAYPNLDALLTLVRAAGQDYASVEQMLGDIGAHSPGVDAWLDLAEAPFSQLCAYLAYTLDPQAIVIGGRLPAPIGLRLIERIRIPRAPNRHGLAPPLPELRIAGTTGDAVTLGAALIPLQRAFFA
ncbi:ROK family protein [Xanthomonas translucens pv. graminis]|jgi:predicted NBD/HSP70 family sugar kinase|uniref:Xylose repressor-like protein n=1 Tax=Xanthomonas graminis pv. graminis TaxID=134874 RepID=A0A1M4L6H7_9XANT|nr:ROK family protein [Xanthomonas translucens]EKU24019.1 xylose repressor-like protein [Xanthomonas translucens pv. graminis ART-Xtg29]OAX59449.1 transcriptional regulator [Xanthomonas translucens pv. graminis]UKE55220.1 ROK family protein [Xanthomonas translucens pv. graminis]WIH09577.1 ROK family protein [Xanthomonas translucens pv. graminis]WIH12904.1 ROK family protein [Xanthomonas translucens pv. graminis]